MLYKVISYPNNGVERLLESYKSLATFAQIAEWDAQATAEISAIENVIEQLDVQIRMGRETVDRERSDRAALPVLQRLFASRKAEKDAQKYTAACEDYKSKLDGLASALQDAVDFTPNAPEDKNQLLKDFRQRKKELQIEKRELTAEMSAVITNARRASASIGPSYGSKWVGRMNAAERRKIRLEKENALRPNENRRAAIERQILEIDKRITWLEKIS